MERIKYIPEKGHIIKLNLSPTRGHEQSGYRPAIVISTKDYNARTKRAIICPITSRVYKYPFVVLIKGRVKGSILVDQVRSIDWRARSVKHSGECSAEILLEIISKLSALVQDQ